MELEESESGVVGGVGYLDSACGTVLMTLWAVVAKNLTMSSLTGDCNSM